MLEHFVFACGCRIVVEDDIPWECDQTRTFKFILCDRHNDVVVKQVDVDFLMVGTREAKK